MEFVMVLFELSPFKLISSRTEIICLKEKNNVYILKRTKIGFFFYLIIYSQNIFKNIGQYIMQY